MPPTWRLARNSLAGKPGRTALMVGAVALSCSLVVAVSCSVRSVQKSLESGIVRILGAADARIIHTGQGRFDADVVDQVRAWPDVEAATGRLLTSLTLVHADHRADPKTGQLARLTPQALGIEPDVEPLFRPTSLLAGRLPEAPHEILIDPLTRDGLLASVGDELEVQRFGDPVRLVVCGIYEQPGLGVIQRPLIKGDVRTFAEASDRTGQISGISIILADGVNVEEFCRAHQENLPAQLKLEPAEMARSGFERQVKASDFGFIVVSVLTFMSASFIIVTALTTAVTERQREMAVLRCVGASRRQLFGSQLLLGVVLGGLGALIGIPVGIGLTAALAWWFAELLPAGLHLHSLGLQLAGGGALTAGLLGAIYPAWMASHVPPLEAMSIAARPPRAISVIVCAALGLAFVAAQMALLLPHDPQTRFLAYAYLGMPLLHVGYFLLAAPTLRLIARAVSPVCSALLGLPSHMLERSVSATLFRHGFTAGALMVGIAILVSTWSTAVSLLDDWLGRIKFADGFAFRTTGILPSQQQAIASLPFVEQVCPIGYLPLRVPGEQVFGIEGLAPRDVIGVGFDPRLFFAMNQIEWVQGDPVTGIPALLDGSGAIVAEEFLNTQKYKLGDPITLSAGRVERTFTIVGAVQAAGLEIAIQIFGIRSAYMDNAIRCVFIDFDVASQTFGNADAYMMQVNLSPEISDADATARIMDAAPGVMFMSGRAILKRVDSIALAMLTVQSTVAFAALVLACLGVGNVILANVHARRYEYGVLRAVGAQRSLILKLILGEVAILGITAIVVGIALGAHLAWVGTWHYRDLAGLNLRVRFPTAPTAIGCLVLLMMACVAAIPGALSAMRRQPSALLAGGRHG